MSNQMKFQIGKNGVTPGVIESLELAFKTHKIVRISVLKGAVRDKEVVNQMAQELTQSLKGEYKYKVIGFTIILRRVGKKAL